MIATLIPISHKQCKAFVAKYHRHSLPVLIDKFRVGVEIDGQLIGVGQAGTPNARGIATRYPTVIEIYRVCVPENSPTNLCSMLYGALCRAAKALGYTHAITYTLTTESGASAKAAGFRRISTFSRDGTSFVKGRQWGTPARPRDWAQVHDRYRWGKRL